MTDEDIKLIIKIVADEAWNIAVSPEENPGRNVPLRIEDLSDDPETCAALVGKIKQALGVVAGA